MKKIKYLWAIAQEMPTGKHEHIKSYDLKQLKKDLAVLQMASIRDCLLDNDCESLWDACNRPPWTVSREDWYAGHFLPNRSNVASTPCQWRLQEEPGHGQLKIGGLTHYVSMRRGSTL